MKFLIQNFESLADIGYLDHFKHANHLKENLFKTLASIVSDKTGIGKKKFREHVETFLDPAFRNAESNDHNQNCAAAAQDFLLTLEKTYGAGIFRAILESHDSRYLDRFENFKHVNDKGSLDFKYPPIPSTGHHPANPILNAQKMINEG